MKEENTRSKDRCYTVIHQQNLDRIALKLRRGSLWFLHDARLWDRDPRQVLILGGTVALVASQVCLFHKPMSRMCCFDSIFAWLMRSSRALSPPSKLTSGSYNGRNRSCPAAGRKF